MPQGKHREGYQRPKKGERRRTAQPLKADALPQSLRDFICASRAYQCTCGGRKAHGHTWPEIEELSAGIGGARISSSAAYRWYDIRVEQARKETEARIERARQIAAALQARSIPELGEAGMNALATELFNAVEAESAGERESALLSFGTVLAKLMAAESGRKKLDVEREKLKQAERRLELMRAKVTGLKKEVEGKKKLTPEELKRKLDEIYGLTA
jgi:hypothetical protein